MGEDKKPDVEIKKTEGGPTDEEQGNLAEVTEQDETGTRVDRDKIESPPDPRRS